MNKCGSKKFRKEYENEILMFLAICSDKDRDFLDIPPKSRKTEDYARLITIARIAEFHNVIMRLFAEAESESDARAREVVACIEKNKNDFSTVNKWVEDFIAEIRVPELQTAFKSGWTEMLRRCDMENFKLSDLFRRN